jgi:hypothetical protein
MDIMSNYYKETKEVDFCFECDEFPCSKLNPASDRANLGKMSVGKGPQMQ